MLKKLIELFIKTNGRSPNALEMLQLKFKAAQQSGKGKVIEFPRDKITDWTKSQSRPRETEIIEGIQTTRCCKGFMGRHGTLGRSLMLIWRGLLKRRNETIVN